MAGRGGILDVDVDRTIGVLREARAVADAVSVNWILHHAAPGIAHGHRASRVIWWESSRRKMEHVVVLSVQPMAGPIHRHRPIHRLLRQIGRRNVLSACGLQKNAITRQAALQGGTPTVDSRQHVSDLGIDDQV